MHPAESKLGLIESLQNSQITSPLMIIDNLKFIFKILKIEIISFFSFQETFPHLFPIKVDN